MARGAGIIFIGTIIGMFFSFISKIILARTFTQAEYGIYSISITLITILSTIALFGFQNGLPRQIGFYIKKDFLKTTTLIGTSVKITIFSSIILSVLLFMSTDFISINIFHDAALAKPLRIFTLAIPIYALIYLLVSISGGFGRVKEKVIFHDIGTPLTLSIGLIILWALKLPFLYVAYTVICTSGLLLVAFWNHVNKSDFSIKVEKFDFRVGKELMIFSLPLLFATILNLIMGWTDTIMLGYFKESSVVGLYNTALPLAKLTLISLTSMGFLFNPLMTELYSKGKIKNMKRMYQITTKWVFSATLPIFLFFFVFPDVVLNFMFGANYVGASVALKILSVGFIFHALMGLNGMSLVVLGKNKFILLTTLIGAVVNVLLNFNLIPLYGIVGAAIASTTAYISINIVMSYKLYLEKKIHPFTRNYVKPLFSGLVLIYLLEEISSSIIIVAWMLPFILIAFFGLYVFLLLITKSFEKEDLKILSAIERKIGFELKIVKNLLRRFV